MNKPSDRIAVFLAAAPALVAVLLTLTATFLYMGTEGGFAGDPVADRLLRRTFGWLIALTAWVRDKWAYSPVLLVSLPLMGYVLWLVGIRAGLQFYNDRIRPKFLPLREDLDVQEGTAHVAVDFWDAYGRLTPEQKAEGFFLGYKPNGEAVMVSDRLRTTHAHVLGATGSGKTQSVLLPLAMQDIMQGKAVVVIDAKGSAENVRAFLAMTRFAGRQDQYKALTLPYPNDSHTYNPIYPIVGDPLSAAQMVFQAFTIEHEYYRGQSQLLFENLVRVCAATGQPFNLQDIDAAVTSTDSREYLFELLEARTKEILTTDKDYALVMAGERAVADIQNQFLRLGESADEVFTGLDFNLRRFDHPLLNSYNPDIRIADDLDKRRVLYFELPANMYSGLAKAVGIIVLQQLQQCSSMRQIDRRKWNQGPVAIFADEFYHFVYPDFIPSLDMSRDANFQFMLAHQEMAHLRNVSDEFADSVKGATLLKIFFKMRNHEVAEEISRSQGTRSRVKNTTQRVEGPLFTHARVAVANERDVEEFELHPNVLKNLAPKGQACILSENGWSVVNLPLFTVPDLPDDADKTMYRRKKGDGLNLRSKKPSKNGADMETGNQG